MLNSREKEIQEWVEYEAATLAHLAPAENDDVPYLLATVGRLRGLLKRCRSPLKSLIWETAVDTVYKEAMRQLYGNIDAELEGCDAD